MMRVYKTDIPRWDKYQLVQWASKYYGFSLSRTKQFTKKQLWALYFKARKGR